jgi:hypothetical protein
MEMLGTVQAQQNASHFQASSTCISDCVVCIDENEMLISSFGAGLHGKLALSPSKGVSHRWVTPGTKSADRRIWSAVCLDSVGHNWLDNMWRSRLSRTGTCRHAATPAITRTRQQARMVRETCRKGDVRHVLIFVF